MSTGYTWPSRFLVSDIRALWRSALSARGPECQKLKMKVRPGWHWTLSNVTIWHHCTLKGWIKFPKHWSNIAKFQFWFVPCFVVWLGAVSMHFRAIWNFSGNVGSWPDDRRSAWSSARTTFGLTPIVTHHTYMIHLHCWFLPSDCVWCNAQYCCRNSVCPSVHLSVCQTHVL